MVVFHFYKCSSIFSLRFNRFFYWCCSQNKCLAPLLLSCRFSCCSLSQLFRGSKRSWCCMLAGMWLLTSTAFSFYNRAVGSCKVLHVGVLEWSAKIWGLSGTADDRKFASWNMTLSMGEVFVAPKPEASWIWILWLNGAQYLWIIYNIQTLLSMQAYFPFNNCYFLFEWRVTLNILNG